MNTTHSNVLAWVLTIYRTWQISRTQIVSTEQLLLQLSKGHTRKKPGQEFQGELAKSTALPAGAPLQLTTSQALMQAL